MVWILISCINILYQFWLHLSETIFFEKHYCRQWKNFLKMMFGLTWFPFFRYEKRCPRNLPNDTTWKTSHDVQCHPQQRNENRLQEVYARCNYSLLSLCSPFHAVPSSHHFHLFHSHNNHSILLFTRSREQHHSISLFTRFMNSFHWFTFDHCQKNPFSILHHFHIMSSP